MPCKDVFTTWGINHLGERLCLQQVFCPPLLGAYRLIAPGAATHEVA